jgi:hypothetical protein
MFIYMKNLSLEKGQKDKQRSTKHTHKTKDRVTRTPLKTGDESRSLMFACNRENHNGVFYNERVLITGGVQDTHSICFSGSNC